MTAVYRRLVGDTVRRRNPFRQEGYLALYVAAARSRRLLEPIERFVRALADPFGALLRSVDPDALPIARVGSTDVRVRDVDSGSLPDLSDFVTAHYPRLIRLAGLITRNTDDAEDAVQAALERAWKGRAALRDKSLFKQWIDRIVVREASRISGSRVRRVARLFKGSGEDEIALDLPDTKAGRQAEMAALRAAFARLSTDQRAVVSLHLYAGYTVVETAEIVGAPVETVRSRLRLARQRLREELEPSS